MTCSIIDIPIIQLLFFSFFLVVVGDPSEVVLDTGTKGRTQQNPGIQETGFRNNDENTAFAV